MAALNQITARTTRPSCHPLVRMAWPPNAATCWMKFATRMPAATSTSGPGHQATNPAKNPQKGPRTFWVHTYSDPSSGNIRPSCAVTNAPVMRKVANARIQKTYMDGPANCTPDELLMNRTIATKTTTRSNGPSVLATRAGATLSESMTCSSACLAIGHLLPESQPSADGEPDSSSRGI